MRDGLKTTLLISGLAIALGGASAASAAAPYTPANDQAAPVRLDNAVSYPGEAGQFEKAQYWGGRNYCFYRRGWRGPGYYWCGYAWRRGYGWGGPVGWHGWGHRGWHDGGHWRDGGRHDGGHWNGGHGNWHGGHDRGDGGHHHH